MAAGNKLGSESSARADLTEDDNQQKVGDSAPGAGSPSSKSLDEILQGLDHAIDAARDVEPNSAGSTMPLTADGGMPPLPTNADDAAETGEDSIERYMQDLLARTQGFSDTNASEGMRETSSTGVESMQRAKTADSDRTSATRATQTEPPEAAADWSPQRAPERRESLQDLRDVANLTAHQAIGSHAAKQIVGRSHDTVVTAMVLQVVSFALVATAPTANSLTFYAAVIAFIVASLWTIRFTRLLGKLCDIAGRLRAEQEQATEHVDGAEATTV